MPQPSKAKVEDEARILTFSYRYRQDAKQYISLSQLAMPFDKITNELIEIALSPAKLQSAGTGFGYRDFEFLIPSNWADAEFTDPNSHYYLATLAVLKDSAFELCNWDWHIQEDSDGEDEY